MATNTITMTTAMIAQMSLPGMRSSRADCITASAAEIVPRSGAESSELPIVQKSYSNDNATESGYHKACSQSPVMRTFRKLLINSHFPQKPLQNTMI